jgi:hypothetical protein
VYLADFTRSPSNAKIASRNRQAGSVDEWSFITAITLEQWKPYFSIKGFSEWGNLWVVVPLGEPVSLTFRCWTFDSKWTFYDRLDFWTSKFQPNESFPNIPRGKPPVPRNLRWDTNSKWVGRDNLILQWWFVEIMGAL